MAQIASWWLLLMLPAISTGLNYSRESLEDIIATFASTQMEVALMMPLVLKLKISPSLASNLNHPLAVQKIMQNLEIRLSAIQKVFQLSAKNQGFKLSNTRRFRIENGKFSMYYYVLYRGTSNLPLLRNQLKKICTTTVGYNTYLEPTFCETISDHQNAWMFVLLLMCKLRALARNSTAMELFAADFQPSDPAYVTASYSEEHDIHNVMCRQFLVCKPNQCNISMATLTPSIQLHPDWKNLDTYMFANLPLNAEGDEKEGFRDLKAASANKIFNQNSDYSDLVLYRSWCMRHASRNNAGPHWMLLAALLTISWWRI